jgi:hypothetical protein
MAMLPAGFTQFSTQGSYESSEKVPSEGRNGGPKHNADGYKSMDIGSYSDGWSDAAKSESTKYGGTDHNTSKAPSNVSLAINEPAAYSRDWSGK